MTKILIKSLSKICRIIPPDPVSRFAVFLFLINKRAGGGDAAGEHIQSPEIKTALEEIPAGELTPEDFVAIFERLLAQEHSSKSGAFYTPPWLAEKIAEESIAPLLENKSLPDIFKVKIFDPACGAGIFLLEALKLAASQFRKTGVDSPENRAAFIKNCLHGTDKDPWAVRAAGLILSLAATGVQDREVFGGNLMHANSLFDTDDFNAASPADRRLLEEEKIISFTGTFPAVFGKADPGFDCIIGNPPYGLARGEKLGSNENKKLQKVYGEYRIGKINKYLAFMARGAGLLNSRGVLSYIVPNAWLAVKSARGIREAFIKNAFLESVDIYGQNVFTDLSVETVVFRAVKGGGSSHVRISEFSGNGPGKPARSFLLPLSFARPENDFLIPAFWDESVSRFEEFIRTSCFRLGDDNSPFKPMIALQAYAAGKGTPPQTKEQVQNHAFHSCGRETAEHLPYLEGKDIQRYSLVWSGSYLRYGKWLAEPQTPGRFSGPRIIIREILRPEPYVLSACFTEDTYLYNKSALHILPASGCTREDLQALTAILNSKVSGKIIKMFGRKSQRGLFPKLLNQDLKSFPVPHAFHSRKKLLAELAGEMAALTGSGRSAEAGKIQDKIDSDVSGLYGTGTVELTEGPGQADNNQFFGDNLHRPLNPANI